MNIEYLFLPLQKLFEINGGRYRHLISDIKGKWHVGAGLTPYNMIQTLNGKTISKLSTLGLIREESVVAA